MRGGEELARADEQARRGAHLRRAVRRQGQLGRAGEAAGEGPFRFAVAEEEDAWGGGGAGVGRHCLCGGLEGRRGRGGGEDGRGG